MVGGGNIGTQFACICASKGFSTKLYCSQPDLFDGILECVNEYNETTIGKLTLITDDLPEALADSKVVFVTYPAFMMYDFAKYMLPFILEETIICVTPGTGGAEFAFAECLEQGAKLIGLQRVPSVARLEKKGKRVRCEGLRPELFIGSIPSDVGYDFAVLMEKLWDIPCRTLPNYLSVTLTPSNPILHTTRLRTLFSDYYPGKYYERNPLFYGEWSDESSKLLLACDEELQNMFKIMKNFDFSCVKSLKQHYESSTVEAMTRKICSIKSLHGLRSPMIQENGGWMPDFKSRYFVADFPYGLAIIESFAEILRCNIPNIRETMNWYRMVTGDSAKFDIKSYGITCLEDIYRWYNHQ